MFLQSTQDNVKLIKQLQSGLSGKRRIIWYKYQSKVVTLAQNQYSDYKTNILKQVFREGIDFFVLIFGNNRVRTGHT